jgi:Calcineurin-like phosphoesterase
VSEWRILVIDDRAMSGQLKGERYEKYKALDGHVHDREKLSVEFATSPEDARQLIASGNYDMALLDVVLEIDDWSDDSDGTIFTDLFEKADAHCAVGLVSSKWDDTSIHLVRRALNNRQNINIPLMFTFKDFDAKVYNVLGLQIVNYVRRCRSLHRLDLGKNDALRILHLSDLHFGAIDSHAIFGNRNSSKTLFDQIMRTFPGSPHLIAVTGDIGNTGHPADYQKALEWFQHLAERFGFTLPSPRILLVPGNHDYCFPLACAASFSPRTEGAWPSDFDPVKYSRPLGAYAMQPFKEFAHKVSTLHGQWDDSPVGAWTETGFREYGVVFSGLNTSKYCRDDCWPARKIDADDVLVVRNALDPLAARIESGRLLHIALSHHSPIAYPKVREPIENDSQDIYLDNFIKTTCAPKLLLHGHQHMRTGVPLPSQNCFVICSPTPSKANSGRAEDAPRGVNLLSFERDDSVVKKVSAKSLYVREDGWRDDPLPGSHEYVFNK